MISLRLQKIAEMVTAGHTIADIGTDHGFLPIELVRSGKAPRAIAMDIVEGPLDRARSHIGAAGLADRIECRLSDGFDALDKGETDTAVVAGMGGDLIADIITRAHDKVRELVLSPHTHYEKVRAVLRKCGYNIIDESMFMDEGKYYLVIKAVRTDAAFADDDTADGAAAVDTAVYDHFGKLLLERRDENLKSYLIHEHDKFDSIEQKREYTELVRRALNIMESEPQ